MKQSMCQGTLFYMTPEIQNGHPFDFSVDVYAYGILVYSVISGRSPYQNVPMKLTKNICDFTKAVVGGKRSNIPDRVAGRWRELIESCGRSDAKLRPSFDDIHLALRNAEFGSGSDVSRFFVYRDRVWPIERP
jgi:serine/threonine protein kinase